MWWLLHWSMTSLSGMEIVRLFVYATKRTSDGHLRSFSISDFSLYSQVPRQLPCVPATTQARHADTSPQRLKVRRNLRVVSRHAGEWKLFNGRPKGNALCRLEHYVLCVFCFVAVARFVVVGQLFSHGKLFYWIPNSSTKQSPTSLPRICAQRRPMNSLVVFVDIRRANASLPFLRQTM